MSALFLILIACEMPEQPDIGEEWEGPRGGWRVTVGDLLLRAARDYAAMYATLTPLPHEEGNPVINTRYPPKGPKNPHGIDMHGIDDLVFELMEVDVTTGRVSFCIGS